MKSYKECLDALSKSSFRSRFHLKKKDLEYVKEKGIEAIRRHAYDFIVTRLAPAKIDNDGKQTPMRNHPVFIAQHGTATCCRGCLEKWYKIEKGRKLTDDEIEFIVNLIMFWIEKEVNYASKN